MADFPGAAWFEDLKEKVNRVEGFQQAARWFQGKVGWKVDDVTYLLSIANERVQSVQIGPEG
ncbi:MAG: hypothetical protein HY788_19905, partial [Deltaproteobacteria bacterium]|nr:hypothetical protein [Deltaproteobacteria bacterium]